MKQPLGLLEGFKLGHSVKVGPHSGSCQGSGPQQVQAEEAIEALSSTSEVTSVLALQRAGGHPGGCRKRKDKISSSQTIRCIKPTGPCI